MGTKSRLLDVNILIALTWPNHFHHDIVKNWFPSLPGNWATCPFTQTAFLRISSNPAIVDKAVSPHTALTVLNDLTGMSNHVFIPADIDLTEIEEIPSHLFFGHRQVTDFYLLLLAKETGCILSTLDQHLFRVAQETEFALSVELIEPVLGG